MSQGVPLQMLFRAESLPARRAGEGPQVFVNESDVRPQFIGNRKPFVAQIALKIFDLVVGGFDVVFELDVGEKLFRTEMTRVVSLPEMNVFHVDAELRGRSERFPAIGTNVSFDLLMFDQVVRRDHALEGEPLAALGARVGL